MLVRSDPFRQFDRLAEQVFGTVARPAAMPMDAWRDGNEFVVEFDLPGIDPASIDLDVEQHVLTVRAERRPATGPEVELVASERPRGVFGRQVMLGDALDTEKIIRRLQQRRAPAHDSSGGAGQAPQDHRVHRRADRRIVRRGLTGDLGHSRGSPTGLCVIRHGHSESHCGGEGRVPHPRAGRSGPPRPGLHRGDRLMGGRVAAAAGPDARGHRGAARSTVAVMAGDRCPHVLARMAPAHSPSHGRSVTPGVVGTGVTESHSGAPPYLLDVPIDALSGDTPYRGDLTGQHRFVQTYLDDLEAELVPGDVHPIECPLGRSTLGVDGCRAEDVDDTLPGKQLVDRAAQYPVPFEQCFTSGVIGLEQFPDPLDDPDPIVGLVETACRRAVVVGRTSAGNPTI